MNNRKKKKELGENWKLKRILETCTNWDSPGYESERLDLKKKKKRQPKKNKENEDGFAVFVVVVLLVAHKINLSLKIRNKYIYIWTQEVPDIGKTPIHIYS